MSDSIEDIKFPSDFLAAIDETHAKATEFYKGISSDAKALTKGRSSQNQNTAPSLDAANLSKGNSLGSGSKSSGPKM